MLNFEHYSQKLLGKSDADYIKKFIGNRKYSSLNAAIYGLKNADLNWISNETTKTKVQTLFFKLASGMEDSKLSYKEKLELIEANLQITSAFPEFEFKQTATGVHGGICPNCGKKELFVPNKGRAMYIKCNRENNCGYSSSILEYVTSKVGSKSGALKELAALAGIDLEAVEKNNEVHIDSNAKEVLKEVLVAKKVPIPIPNKIEYEVFNKSQQYKVVDIRKFFDSYTMMNQKQKFMMIVTVLYLISKETKQWGKENYLKSRKLDLVDKYNQLCKELGYLHASDITATVNYLKHRFGEDDLIEFGILNEKGKFKHHCEEGFVVIPNFDLYTNMVTGLKLRNTKLAEWQNKGLKEPELSFGRIANPLPNGLTRDALLDAQKQFRFFEGKMDSSSIPADSRFCDIAIPGVNGISDQQLGYFKQRVVYICFDMDKAGIKHAEILKAKLEQAGAIAIIIQWDSILGNDVNEVLVNGNIAKLTAKFSSLGAKAKLFTEKFGNFVYQMIQ